MILLALLACQGDAPVSTSESFLAYAGKPGRSLEFVRSESTDSTPLLLEVNEDGSVWETRYGSRWSSAEPRDSFDVLRDAGLFVDDQQLLPERISVGATGEGVEISAIDAHTVWYGTFEDAVIVSVDSGRFTGEQVFAREIGPIALSLDGATWELAWYE